ncbi:hypothetical protein PybrP1_003972, partial [[Pythium] brassicae (nom. inval.)]
YLGIPFSQSSVDHRILESLDQRFYDGFKSCVELLRSILPRYGGNHALDFLTISPQRHGDMIKWRHASIWWKSTQTWWHRTRWEITWRDLPSDERAVD